MALPSSGNPISLNQIHQEAGGTSATTCTINDSDIRALIGKTSGTTNRFSEYYGVDATPNRTLTYVTHASVGGGTSISWGSKSIGTASSDRVVVVVATFFRNDNSNFSAPTCSIGGVSATRVAYTTSYMNRGMTGVFTRLVTSGTTASIVTSGGLAVDAASIQIYRLNGGTNVNDKSWTQTGASSGTSLSRSVGIDPNSAVLVCSSTNSSGFYDISYVNCTLKVNSAIEVYRYGSAIYNSATTATRTFTQNHDIFGGAVAYPRMLVVEF